jgi:hypothetical protein
MLALPFSFGDGAFCEQFLSLTSPQPTTPGKSSGPRHILILVFGEPFPDASVVVPFGCGALLLLDNDDRAKFQSRCALMIFIHYATSHPLYTYAFFSPRTKRVIYRQDAIFLVNTFPRAARLGSGLPVAGESLVTFRSPFASAVASEDKLSFQNWQSGDTLPEFDNHVAGVPLVDDPNSARDNTPPDFPVDWPRRYPHHLVRPTLYGFSSITFRFSAACFLLRYPPPPWTPTMSHWTDSAPGCLRCSHAAG